VAGDEYDEPPVGHLPGVRHTRPQPPIHLSALPTHHTASPTRHAVSPSLGVLRISRRFHSGAFMPLFRRSRYQPRRLRRGTRIAPPALPPPPRIAAFGGDAWRRPGRRNWNGEPHRSPVLKHGPNTGYAGKPGKPGTSHTGCFTSRPVGRAVLSHSDANCTILLVVRRQAPAE